MVKQVGVQPFLSQILTSHVHANTSPLSLVLVVIVNETDFGQFSPTVVLVRNPKTLTALPTSLIDLGKTGPLRRSRRKFREKWSRFVSDGQGGDARMRGGRVRWEVNNRLM